MALTRQTKSFHRDNVTRTWHVVDAAGIPLGRLASRVATVLRGKHKPTFTPNGDAGDFVVVLNAGQVKLTGEKAQKKFAYRHSGYPGGFRAVRYDNLLENKPTFVVEKAVRGMLPKTSLGRQMLKKLKVYDGTEHPHVAQGPETLTIDRN